MDYLRTSLKSTIEINKIITLYYFEFDKYYKFSGELHDFWEFLYVDKGEIEVLAGQTRHMLRQGTLIFHKPNEFHSFYSYHGTAPNLIVMTFDCKSIAMKHFENKVICLQDEQRNLLAQIIKEGANAFHFPFKYPLQRNKNQPIGCEQLIKAYLEIFLIQLLRKDTLIDNNVSLSSLAKEKDQDGLTSAIIHYMEQKLDTKVTLTEMSHTLHVAKTMLKDVFKKNTGYSIMEYFSRMKIERAKAFIRDDVHNFTEISQKIGFSSVHYFSKTFKKAIGMSPSEYAKSVKARSSIE